MTISDATRIRVIRAMLGMTSAEFAKRLNVCAGTMTAWERGRSSPQGENKKLLAELCQEFGIGFSPTGFPFPASDCVVFRQENHNG